MSGQFDFEHFRSLLNLLSESPWFTVATNVFSVAVGYWCGVRGERRKEYNAIADDLYQDLCSPLAAASATLFVLDNRKVEMMRRHLGAVQRKRFDVAVEELRTTTSETTQDSAGQVFFSNVDGVNTAREKLAGVLKRK